MLPTQLKDMDFDMSLSYNEIKELLERGRFQILKLRKPVAHPKYGFQAELEVIGKIDVDAYRVFFSFFSFFFVFLFFC
jgi:hypothetical protein